MTLGLIPENELVLRWQWLPEPAPPLDLPFAERTARAGETFLAHDPSPQEWAAYRFNFAQLARLTPDLRLYRLVRIFNTPLLTMTTREAGHAQWRYWHGKIQKLTPPEGGEPVAHLWFFADQSDGDHLVVEYGFDGTLAMRTQTKQMQALRRRLEIVLERLAVPPSFAASRVRAGQPNACT